MLLVRCFYIGTLVALFTGLEFRYHNSVEVEDYLRYINRTFPDFTHLHSIGKSVEGRDLWVLILGKNPKEHTIGIPEFKYVGNMHGNEVVGRMLLLQLIHYLTRYYRNDPQVTSLLNTTRVHILPTMNPDGFEASQKHCLYSQGRFNKNGVDLNRNFPDAFFSQQEVGGEFQSETEVRAIIYWLKTQTFLLSANLHGGAVVASYPYDNSNSGRELQGGASVSPDNDVFVHLAEVYSFTHTSMHLGNSCIGSKPFTNGITNGYQWYSLPGGMQDYNYVWAQCLELTLELSCCKYPPESELQGLWESNRAALLTYIRQVHLGVKGRVFDDEGIPVENAVVEVEGRQNICPFRSNQNGEYYRLLLPGNYTFKVTFPGHQMLRETLSVPYGPDTFSALSHDFKLQRSSVKPTSTASVSFPCSSTLNHLEGGSSMLRAPWTILGLGIVLVLKRIQL